MKNHTSISHFGGREQHVLLRLKNKIVELYRPLIIYLIGYNSSTGLTRNCFAHPGKDNQWHFSCDLLLVLPNGESLPENAAEELKNTSNDYEHIHLIAHPFDFVEKQLQEYSLFFCWMQRRAIVLYERDRSIEKLPEPVEHMKQYEQQVHQFFAHNPNYENYAAVKLSPSPIKQEEKVLSLERPKLSAALQKNMAIFLREHGAKDTSSRMRQAMMEYVRSVTEIGVPNEFNDILWDFEHLMEFFDLAAEEFKGSS